MLTRNYRNLMAQMVMAGGHLKSVLASKAIDGSTRYISNSVSNTSAFPYSVGTALQLGTGAGISLGTGTTQPTLDDYTMEERITAGLSASVVRTVGEEDGSPYVVYDLTVTNTSARAVTVTEIGYQQNILSAVSESGSAGNAVHLLDRTLLDEPVTIPAGQYAVIRYKLQTLIGG